MKGEICDSKKDVQETAYNDDRFGDVLGKARELRMLSVQLNEMANFKFNDLLGVPEPIVCGAADRPEPASWIDEVIIEQNITIDVLTAALSRVAVI